MSGRPANDTEGRDAVFAPGLSHRGDVTGTAGGTADSDRRAPAAGGQTSAAAYGKADEPFDHVWYWRKKLPDRKGTRCRVLARGAKNTILVEFESDGRKVSTSRHAVRYAGPPK